MGLYQFLSVEVILLFCGFAMVLEGSIYTNLYVYRTCYAVLGYNKSDCAQLGNEVNNLTKYLEPKVQPTVNNIKMVQSVIGTLFPMFFNIFVGIWSDRFGRKPFLLLCLIGVIFTTAGNILIVYFEDASPWWFIITSIPSLVTGGFGSMFIVISAYLVDTSASNNRVVRFSVFEIIFGFTSFIGSLVSAPLFYATSYTTIFIIANGLQIASFIYTLMFIPESNKHENSKTNRVPRFGDLIKHIGVKAILKDVFRKRENNGRAYLLAIIGIELLAGFAGGQMSVATLFLRAKLQWTLSKVNNVHAVTSVLNLVGTLVGTFLLYKMLKIKELQLALFATLAASIGNLLWGLATNDYYIYIAYIINIFFGLSGLMWKTVLSYTVGAAEIGKILAVQSILQSLNGLLSQLVYTNIYNATINIDSGIFNFLSFGIHIVVAICIMFMLRINIPRHENSLQENGETEENTKKTSLNNNIEDADSKKSSLPTVVDVNNLNSSNIEKKY